MSCYDFTYKFHILTHTSHHITFIRFGICANYLEIALFCVEQNPVTLCLSPSPSYVRCIGKLPKQFAQFHCHYTTVWLMCVRWGNTISRIEQRQPAAPHMQSHHFGGVNETEISSGNYNNNTNKCLNACPLHGINRASVLYLHKCIHTMKWMCRQYNRPFSCFCFSTTSTKKQREKKDKTIWLNFSM